MEEDAAQFDAAHRQLLSDGSIQFELPQWQTPKPPAWAQPFTDLLTAIAPYFIYFFWGAVILGALVIITLIVFEMTGVAWKMPWQRDAKPEVEEEVWRPDVGVAQILLSEADDLAARGQYDEAVHLLLRRSVADIATRLSDFLRPSLTARDIANAPSLPEQPRSAFDRMARIVEAAFFARQPVGEPEWREARGAYERFAFRDAWA